jgi:hypothetical protein
MCLFQYKKRPVIPLMLWRPHEPVYPRLIKTTIDGLSIEETKEMRKKGLAVPPLTKLGICYLRFFFFFSLQQLVYVCCSLTQKLQLQPRMVIMVVWCPWSEMLSSPVS